MKAKYTIVTDNGGYRPCYYIVDNTTQADICRVYTRKDAQRIKKLLTEDDKLNDGVPKEYLKAERIERNG